MKLEDSFIDYVADKKKNSQLKNFFINFDYNQTPTTNKKIEFVKDEFREDKVNRNIKSKMDKENLYVNAT